MRILTIGGVTLDHIAKVDGTLASLSPGEKLAATAMTRAVGGGGANAAACFRRLGHTVSLVAALGEDAPCRDVAEWAQLRRVDVVAQHVDEPTGLAQVLVDGEGEALIVAARGANQSLSLSRLADLAFSAFQGVYVSSIPATTAHTLADVLAPMLRAGAQLAINPAAHLLTGGVPALLALRPFAPLLCLNAAEANRLLATLATDEAPANPNELCAALAAYGFSKVAVTLGKEGAIARIGGKTYHQSAAPCKVVSSLGAGDAFHATLFAHLLEGMEPARAMRHAASQAASVVATLDSQSGLLDRVALELRERAFAHEQSGYHPAFAQ